MGLTSHRAAGMVRSGQPAADQSQASTSRNMSGSAAEVLVSQASDRNFTTCQCGHRHSNDDAHGPALTEVYLPSRFPQLLILLPSLPRDLSPCNDPIAVRELFLEDLFQQPDSVLQGIGHDMVGKEWREESLASLQIASPLPTAPPPIR
jgi:hypothetical protein